METTNSEEDDDWELITPEPIDGPVPAELATGNPDDDQLLMQIAAVASLDQPREWRHYLCAPDEESAQALARPLARSGIWDVEIFAADDGDERVLGGVERVVVVAGDAPAQGMHPVVVAAQEGVERALVAALVVGDQVAVGRFADPPLPLAGHALSS